MNTYIKTFSAYNTRRFSRPWAATIKFDDQLKAIYEFNGSFLGTHDSGNGEGDVVIKADTGAIIAFGQKDLRGGRTKNEWFVAQEDGGMLPVPKPEALKFWLLNSFGAIAKA